MSALDTTFKLFPFQAELVRRVATSMKENKNVMMQSATGSGKSVMLSKFAKFVPGQVFWLAHREFLQQQAEQHLGKMGVWDAEVTSAMKFRNRVLSGEYKPTSDDLMIVDEAHHSASQTMVDIIKGNERKGVPEFPGRVLGATATPWRMSRKEGFDSLYDDLICGPQTSKLVKMGYLARPEVLLPDDDSLIIRGGGAVGELDYKVSGTWEANSYQIMVEFAIDWLVRQGSRAKRSLIYAIGNEHAQELLKVLQDKHGKTGRIINADSTWDERIEAQFLLAKNEIDAIVNVEIYTEGYDIRTCDCVLLARPTLSLALYLQMIGRSMRPWENKVPIVLDCCGLSLTHGMPTLDRSWTLSARGGDRAGMTPTKKCPKCGRKNHTATKNCKFCTYNFFYSCPRCSKPVSAGENCGRCINTAPERALQSVPRRGELPMWDEGEGIPILRQSYRDVFTWAYPTLHNPPPLIVGQAVIAHDYRGNSLGRYEVVDRLFLTHGRRYKCEPLPIEADYEFSDVDGANTIDVKAITA